MELKWRCSHPAQAGKNLSKTSQKTSLKNLVRVFGFRRFPEKPNHGQVELGFRKPHTRHIQEKAILKSEAKAAQKRKLSRF